MNRVTVHAAKTNLSRLLARVEAGEEIVLMRGKTPVARLAPLKEAAPTRAFGALRGQIKVDDSFFEPLAEDELAAWE